MIKINELPDLQYLKSVLAYDENSPSGLVWIHSKKPEIIGKPAGSIHITKKFCYRSWGVGLFKKVYPAHRIVWALCNNIRLDVCYEIDHINQNPLDNRIENLRQSNRTHNTINVSIKKNNKSGVAGVHYDKSKGVWFANISVNKTEYKLNKYKNKEDAIVCRLENMLIYYPEHLPLQLYQIKDTYPEIYNKFIGVVDMSNFILIDQQKRIKEINKITHEEIRKYNHEVRILDELSLIKRIVEFIKQNNKAPAKESNNPIEKTLGCKLSNLKRQYNKKSKQIYKETVEYLQSIGMLHILEHENLIYKQLEQIKDIVEFITKNNKIPSEQSQDKSEKSMSQKLRQLKQIYKNNKNITARLYQETIDYLKSIDMLNILETPLTKISRKTIFEE